MLELNYTHQGRRPSTKQILAAWTKAGKPTALSVEYGETIAYFELFLGRWVDSGNGCAGVDRSAVCAALNQDEHQGCAGMW